MWTGGITMSIRLDLGEGSVGFVCPIQFVACILE